MKKRQIIVNRKNVKVLMIGFAVSLLSGCTMVYKTESKANDVKMTKYGVLGVTDETRAVGLITIYSKRELVDDKVNEPAKEDKKL